MPEANYFDKYDNPPPEGTQIPGNYFDKYGELEYTPPAPVAEPDSNYGWGITTAFKRGFERLRSLPDVAQGDYEELAQHFENLEQYDQSPEDQERMRELQNTEGWWEAISYYLKNPALIAQVVAESLPMSIAPLAGGIAGGVAGGAAGTAVAGPAGTAVGTIAGTMGGAAAGSYATEYLNSILDYFSREGIDSTDAEQLKAAFTNSELMAEAREFASDRGVPIAIFDALSFGLAGRLYKPATALVKGAAGRTMGMTGEVVMQAGAGASGEATAQLASVGYIEDIPGVVAEAFGEIVPGILEQGANALMQTHTKETGSDDLSNQLREDLTDEEADALIARENAPDTLSIQASGQSLVESVEAEAGILEQARAEVEAIIREDEQRSDAFVRMEAQRDMEVTRQHQQAEYEQALQQGEEAEVVAPHEAPETAPKIQLPVEQVSAEPAPGTSLGAAITEAQEKKAAAEQVELETVGREVKADKPVRPKKPTTPRKTRMVNVNRDSLLVQLAKGPIEEQLSKSAFESEGIDPADMRTTGYAKKSAFTWSESLGRTPDDLAELLNERNYPHPDGTTEPWTANTALEAIADELTGGNVLMSEAATAVAAQEEDYQLGLDQYEEEVTRRAQLGPPKVHEITVDGVEARVTDRGDNAVNVSIGTETTKMTRKKGQTNADLVREVIKTDEEVRVSREARGKKVQKTELEVTPAETTTIKPIERFMDRAMRNYAMEEQGQAILDDLEASETSPRDVAQRFWRETYSKLNAETQQRFRLYVSKLTGMKPGAVTSVDRDGNQTIAKDWLELADFLNEDISNQVEHLEGTERGYIALMQWANEQAVAEVEAREEREAIQAESEEVLPSAKYSEAIEEGDTEQIQDLKMEMAKNRQRLREDKSNTTAARNLVEQRKELGELLGVEPGEATIIEPEIPGFEDTVARDAQGEPLAGEPGAEPTYGQEALTQEDLDSIKQEAATSPENDLTPPTEAQKEAGNYKMAHRTIAGLPVTIENPEGSTRRGFKMRDHYGYIKRTEDADGEQVDVFVNPKVAEDFEGNVWVIDQTTEDGVAFDEHKVMLGYTNQMDAVRAYKRNYEKGWKVGPITQMSMPEFKTWLEGDTTKAIQTPKPSRAGRKFVRTKKGLRFSLPKAKKALLADAKNSIPGADAAWINSVIGDPTMTAEQEDNAMRDVVWLFEGTPSDIPLGKTGVEAVIKPLVEKVPALKAEVHESFSAMPEGPLKESLKDARRRSLPAVYDIVNDTIHLFSDKIPTSRRAIELLLHEGVAHKGLRALFSKTAPSGTVVLDVKAFNTLMEDVYKNATDRKKIAELESAYAENINITIRDRRVVGEEYIAWMAESGKQPALLKRVIAAIRVQLRKLGIVEEWTDNDINSLLRETRSALVKEGKPLSEVTLTEEVQVEETGEIFDVETKADIVLQQHDKRTDVVNKLRACL